MFLFGRCLVFYVRLCTSGVFPFIVVSVCSTLLTVKWIPVHSNRGLLKAFYEVSQLWKATVCLKYLEEGLLSIALDLLFRIKMFLTTSAVHRTEKGNLREWLRSVIPDFIYLKGSCVFQNFLYICKVNLPSCLWRSQLRMETWNKPEWVS